MKLKIMSAVCAMMMVFALSAQTPQKRGESITKTSKIEAKEVKADCCDKKKECTNKEKAGQKGCCSENKETTKKSTSCCSDTKAKVSADKK